MTDIFEIKAATVEDVPLILTFIKELADYEKLLHEVVATEDLLKETLKRVGSGRQLPSICNFSVIARRV